MAARRANRGNASLFGDDERPTLVAFPEPTGEASSLHDLFGGGSDEAAAGALTFTRPQQPLAAGRPAAAETAAASGSTIYAQLVQVFRDVGGAWQPVGQSGLALMGSPTPATHQLVLYDAFTAAFDWNHEGADDKALEVETDRGMLLLDRSGERLAFNDALLLDRRQREYEAVYGRFAALIGSGEGDIDAIPLRHVEEAFSTAVRKTTEPFFC